MTRVLSARWLPVVRFLVWLGVAEEVRLKPALPKPTQPVTARLEPTQPTLLLEWNRDRALLLNRLRATDAMLGLAFRTRCACDRCRAKWWRT